MGGEEFGSKDDALDGDRQEDKRIRRRGTRSPWTSTNQGKFGVEGELARTGSSIGRRSDQDPCLKDLRIGCLALFSNLKRVPDLFSVVQIAKSRQDLALCLIAARCFSTALE